MIKKAYMANIPFTNYCVRVPRWLYNRWPWCGVVFIWENKDQSK